MSRWFFSTVSAPFHSKFARLSDAATALWWRAGCWAKGELTDGFVPEHMLRTLRGKKSAVRELVMAKLWHARPGGWVFHDWAQYQRLREEIEQTRALEAARKARWRHNVSGRTDAGRDAGQTAASGRTTNTDVSDVPPDETRDTTRDTDRTRRRTDGGVPLPSLSPDLSISRSHIQKEDLLHLPPQLTLTGDPANVQVGRGGTFESGDDNAHEACRWLDAILQETLTRAAPRCGGKWTKPYRFIGAQPLDERWRVEACLRAVLASGRLKGRMCTPDHVADYWADYVRGEPPGAGIELSAAGNGRRRGSGPSAVSTAEEFAAERAAERAARGEG